MLSLSAGSVRGIARAITKVLWVNGWHHAYDMGLVVDEQNITLRLSDGRPIALSHPDEAEATLDVKERVELRIDCDGRYTLYQIDEDLYYHFYRGEL